MQSKDLVFFMCVLALSFDQFIYLMFFVGFKSIKKGLIKITYFGKNLAVTIDYFFYGHISLKRERIIN